LICVPSLKRADELLLEASQGDNACPDALFELGDSCLSAGTARLPHVAVCDADICLQEIHAAPSNSLLQRASVAMLMRSATWVPCTPKVSRFPATWSAHSTLTKTLHSTYLQPSSFGSVTIDKQE